MKIEITNLDEFQGILWSKPISKLSLERDKIYIIHQVLSFGSLKQIKWLFKQYSGEEIAKIFLENPKKVYTAAVFNFIKNFVLDFNNKELPKNRYVKTLSRSIE
ncbi:hypothetical protein KJ591_03275 [Patescibacteria group bacterium]|nr:hypothetical protein [Patescibacteria group bacterium]MBU4023350.1 hypothetical protein [Patescibacteria group bacterium]